jgi:hypothetical protein
MGEPEFVKDFCEWLNCHHRRLHVIIRNKRNTVCEKTASLCDCWYNIWLTRPLHEIM